MTLQEKIAYWHDRIDTAEHSRKRCAIAKDAIGADAYYIQRETARRCLDALYAELHAR